MPTCSSLTRRELLEQGKKMAMGIAAGFVSDGFSSGASETQHPALSEFDYAQVQLAPGSLDRQVRESHELLLNLNEDSLLRPFRQREGLPAPGSDLGGWYDTYAFAPACTFGQWLSALARYYAIGGDEATRHKVGRLVQGFAGTIDPAGKFYVENRFPAYIYDKLVCGLVDAHTFAGDPAAMSVLSSATDAAIPHLPPKAMPRQETPVVAHEDFTRHCWDESYTLPENLFLAWRRSGDARYLTMAKRFLFDEYFDPLSNGENVLPGKHAYSHMNALSSAAQAYISLGDEKYLRAARNGFEMVAAQSFATGGWGPDEHFISPGGGKLGDSLRTTHASFETPCGSYAHFKITRYLLRITKDSRYGDSMERVMYNTVLGAKPIQPDGAAFYYSDYNVDGRKSFHPDRWPCCSGTLPQVTADYRIATYFHNSRGLYVNLYVPSAVTWRRPGAQYTLRQVTEYPYDNNVKLELKASAPAMFSIFLRIPQWASGARLAVNGSRRSRELTPGAFAEVRREWKDGDRIHLELPLARRLESIDPQHPGLVALVSGPLVLMALPDGTLPSVSRAALLAATQSSATSRAWTVSSQSRTLRLKAFPDIRDEHYSTYLQVS